MSKIWDADEYATHAAFVPAMGRGLVDLLSPEPGDAILDLGCGDGQLTHAIEAMAATVIGVDRSHSQVAAATGRKLLAVVADGHFLPFANAFDAVFSNAALHWMKKDPAAVLAAVWRVLRPGGRLVAEMGGKGNVAPVRLAWHDALRTHGIDPESVDPWYFPSAESYRSLLLGQGFDVQLFEQYSRPTVLSTHLTGWMTTFTQPFLRAIPEQEREVVLQRIVDDLKPILHAPYGRWIVPYERLRFVALKSSGVR